MKVAIYGQNYKNEALEYLDILLACLHSNNIEVVIEKQFYELLESDNSLPTFSSHQDLNTSFNLMFTIGGDLFFGHPLPDEPDPELAREGAL